MLTFLFDRAAHPRSTVVLTALTLLLVATTAGLQAGETGAADEPAPQATIKMAPDFSLNVNGGGTIQLSEQLRKGPVLLDFWATWCAPCKRAMPKYAELAKKYAGHGLQLLAISEDNPRAHSKIAPYLKAKGFEFPALLDGDQKVGVAYGVQVLPTTFLVDQDGSIVLQHVGFHDGDEKDFEMKLKKMLGIEGSCLDF